MTGNEVYENEYKKRLKALFNNNPDRKYLVGFSNFISDKSYATIYMYTEYVNVFMNYADKEPKDLGLDDYTGYLAEIKSKTASYQIVVYNALKEFSQYLKGTGVNTSDPMQYKKKPKFKEGIKTKEKRKNSFLEKKEIRQYINEVKKGVGSGRAKARQVKWYLRDICIISLLLNTGMRCGALWKLDIDNIDLDNKKLVTIDKGEKTQEYVLSDKMVKCLKQWLEDRSNKLEGHNETALFISNRLTRMTLLSIRNIVNKYGINIEGKYITPHKLRATAITSVYEATNDVYIAQQFAGHADISTTAKIYIRGKEDGARQTGAEIMSKIANV